MQPSQIGSSDNRDNRLPGAPGAPLPSVLLLGGVDPSGGAGLVRDVLTATALGARPIAVGTAWTEQGPGIHTVEARGGEALRDSVRHALAAKPTAVKIGMVTDALAVSAILEGLGAFEGPVVVDPVLASSRGGALFRGTPDELLPLLRRATLVTPNAPEAATLSGLAVTGLEAATAAARALGDRGVAAVLIKGGHLGAEMESVTDVLLTGGEVHRLTHPRIPGGDVRGTGCALATAIAVHLGRGAPMLTSVQAATRWLEGARARAVEVDVGVGVGVRGERHLG